METILLVSIAFQLVAVIIAIKLIKITKVFFPWLMVSVAILLMVIRRSITLIHLLKENTTVSGETSSEYVALSISILLSVGLFFMIPLFKSFKEHDKELENKNKELIKINETAIRNKDKFKNLWNLSFEGILIHDNKIALETNLSLLNMFGYNGTELIGKNIIKLLILKKHHIFLPIILSPHDLP